MTPTLMGAGQSQARRSLPRNRSVGRWTMTSTIFLLVGSAPPALGVPIEYVFGWTADVNVTRTSVSRSLYEDVPFQLVVSGDTQYVRPLSSVNYQGYVNTGDLGTFTGIPTAQYSAIGGPPELSQLGREIVPSFVHVYDGAYFDDARYYYGLYDELGINVHVPDGSALDGYDLRTALTPVRSTRYDEAGSYVDERFFDLTLTDPNGSWLSDWSLNFDVGAAHDISFMALRSSAVPEPPTFFLLACGTAILLAARYLGQRSWRDLTSTRRASSALC